MFRGCLAAGGKSLLGKHLIHQATDLIEVLPAGVKAPKITVVCAVNFNLISNMSFLKIILLVYLHWNSLFFLVLTHELSPLSPFVDFILASILRPAVVTHETSKRSDWNFVRAKKHWIHCLRLSPRKLHTLDCSLRRCYDDDRGMNKQLRAICESQCSPTGRWLCFPAKSGPLLTCSPATSCHPVTASLTSRATTQPMGGPWKALDEW